MDRILNEQRLLLGESLEGGLARLTPDNLLSVLSVVYVHLKSEDGGDLYLTRHGVHHAKHLALRNWYAEEWFTKHRERLKGTSCVYRVPTRPVEGESMELLVKNCRVGEHVPLDTHTLQEFMGAEFNSPWEEFALVTEMRVSSYGPSNLRIATQEPLAIYVPPERMQKWQTGRSRSKINKIQARHPGISLDILRQYKLVYGWIPGRDIVEVLRDAGVPEPEMLESLARMTNKAIADMAAKGYVVADMKPQHVVIGAADVEEVVKPEAVRGGNGKSLIQGLEALVFSGRYSVVDYELLLRTEDHHREVQEARRHSYLDCQKTRFVPTAVPMHLKPMEVMGVPYIFGHVESTGGSLWVVGRNARLVDYFLPERWRKMPSIRFSENNEVCYTLTKDNIHIVWKTSRVGEQYKGTGDDPRVGLARRHGFNSPFEEGALALELNAAGIATTYLRAIYMTGIRKIEKSEDFRRYTSHQKLRDPSGAPLLQGSHNYITVWGYFNGPDEWVAEHEGSLLRPLDLDRAVLEDIILSDVRRDILEGTQQRLEQAGYDGRLLKENDILIAIHPDDSIFLRPDGSPDTRICALDLISRLSV